MIAANVSRRMEEIGMTTDKGLMGQLDTFGEEQSAYEMALQQFDEAAEALGLKQGMAEYLRRPQRELTVNFPVRMDSGEIRMFTVERMLHILTINTF